MSKATEVNKVLLDPVLKSENSIGLWNQINSHKGKNVKIDAAKVERLGGLCLETLVAASLAWKKSGVNFEIINVSDRFLKDVDLLGAKDLLPICQGEEKS